MPVLAAAHQGPADAGCDDARVEAVRQRLHELYAEKALVTAKADSAGKAWVEAEPSNEEACRETYRNLLEQQRQLYGRCKLLEAQLPKGGEDSQKVNTHQLLYDLDVKAALLTADLKLARLAAFPREQGDWETFKQTYIQAHRHMKEQEKRVDEKFWVLEAEMLEGKRVENTEQQRLYELDAEARLLRAKEQAAFKALLLAKPEDEETCKQAYDDLVAQQKHLDGRLDQLIKGPRVMIRDKAPRLVQHEDDPTMYDLINPDGSQSLFHDLGGAVGFLRRYLEQEEPHWCYTEGEKGVSPLFISGGDQSGQTFIMNVVLHAVMAETEAYAKATPMDSNLRHVTRTQGFEEMCSSLLTLVLEQAKDKNLVTAALMDTSESSAEARLIKIFETMDVPLAVQIESVQWLLSPRLQRDGRRINRITQQKIASLLRRLWWFSSKYVQWTVTDDNVALLWTHLGKMTTDKIDTLTRTAVLHLPQQHSNKAKETD